jgi:hypothetical protein
MEFSIQAKQQNVALQVSSAPGKSVDLLGAIGMLRAANGKRHF